MTLHQEYRNNVGNINTCPICKHNDGWKSSGAKKVYICGFCENVSLVKFKPMHYQMRVLVRREGVVGMVGAYGTGKTTVANYWKLGIAMELEDATGLFTSGTLAQLERASYKEMLQIIPPRIIEKQKMSSASGGYIRLINGHEMMYAVSNEQNLRSLNITYAHIEEANGVEHDVYTQLLARIRDSGDTEDLVIPTPKAIRQQQLKRKYLQISYTTNPEDSWITDKVLLRTNYVHNYTLFELPDKHSIMESSYATLASSYINQYLDDAYIQRMLDNYETDEERRTYVGGDFRAKAGRVVSDVDRMIYQGDVNLTRSIRICGFDIGQGGANGDPQSFLVGRVLLKRSDRTGLLQTHIFITKEVYSREVTTIPEWVEHYNRILDSERVQSDMGIFGDNIHGNKKYAYDSPTTMFDEYKRNGLRKLKGAKNSKVNIETRASMLKSWAKEGRIHIDKDCENLIKELKLYKQVKVSTNGSSSKQKAKFKGPDHAIDCLTNIIMELPNKGQECHKEWFDNAFSGNMVGEMANSSFNYKDIEMILI